MATAPPLSTARLEGTYEVTLTVSKVRDSTSKKGETADRLYVFIPQCEAGPCDVDLVREGGGGISEHEMLLEDGAYVTKEGGRQPCGSGTVRVETEIRLEVVEAQEVEGVFRATGLEGSFRVTNTAARGTQCSGRYLEVSDVEGSLST